MTTKFAPMYPNPPAAVVPVSAQTGACSNTPVKISIGQFTRDVNLAEVIRKAMNQQDATMESTCSFGDFLGQLLTFDSTMIKLNATAPSNQLCYFEINRSKAAAFAGASHFANVPIYCNVVQQFPSYGVTLHEIIGGSGNGLPSELMIPTTTGQFNLQYSLFNNPLFIFGDAFKLDCKFGSHGDHRTITHHTTTKEHSAALINLLPLVARFSVPAGTQIYAIV